MAPPLLILRDIRLGFGGVPLFDGVEMSISKGERISLVGRNGCGKSTLMKVIAGLMEPDAGEVFRQPGLHVTYLVQEPDLSGFATVLDYVVDGLPHHSAEDAHIVEPWLEDLKLDGAQATTSLSGGERRRAALARGLVSEPDILLLDEPTNHLDLNAIQWLEDVLGRFKGAFVTISHDRAFLNLLTRAVLWLDRGRVRRLDKGFAHFEEWSDTIMEQEAVERHKLDKLIAEETRWSHQGISARRKRNQGRLRRLQSLRSERAQQIDKTGSVKLETEKTESSGKLVVEVEGLRKAYGDRVIVKDFATRILRGDKVGIIGPNGAGKSTLLKMLTGDLKPDEGHVRLGTNLETLYLDQNRDSLDPDKSLWDTLCERGGDMVMVQGRQRHVVAYLKDFLFDEKQARGPVNALSGGERNRLVLAKALTRPCNFLILDEPTNDLDIDTLDLLQEMLADFEGTLLLVSHDRDFLDRIVTSTIVLEGDGSVEEYPGGYSDYQRQRQAREQGPVRKEAPTKRTGEKPAADRKATKLSYKQERALKELPKRIDRLQMEITQIHEQLEDPEFYQRDPEQFSKTTNLVADKEKELGQCEEEWLELEILRESLASERNT
ncbi:ABC-F family ATP-binding cassette domain-containing protein [Magnetospira sp. QH-2]|uniref:ABC-F family ATP-binding cassette domain-containing protein n=1 Tax=Magnetospira sp. (strain QH-2) TaxID=1288970 RepID=UPI0003E81591|nr:ATP-binding cassette domain-containing protein [Magnetospira sp. QH-2]CCQ72671.1 fused ATP-binding subunits of ABC transporter [Magnetospira sp. QH-2]